MSVRTVQVVSVVRGLWGGVLLLGPAAVLRAGGLHSPTPRAISVARLLGARQVAQAALTILAPQVTGFGAVVDGVHAAGNLGVAAASHRWRSPALIDAAVAAAFGVVSWTARPRKDMSG